MVAITAQPPKSRWDFPFKEPEQWWEIWHNTERSLAAQFAMMPVNAIARRLLEDPAIAAKKSASGRNKKALEVATYEYLENVFTRTTGAQIIRSWTSLYGNDKKFQKCVHAGELLSGLTASAAYHDKESIPLAEELKNGHVTPVHDFIFHSSDANQMMSDFVTGELDVTPTNLRQMEQHLQAMSELSAQPLAMAEEMRRNSTQPTSPHTRPSDYIREVLEAKQLQTPRQMQILFSLIPPMITHGALALSHVEYVPQEKKFLTVDQSVRLAKAVEETLNANAYEYNHDSDGKPLLENVPASAIIKKTDNGYEVLSEQELLQFGNRLLHKTKEIAGQNLNRILAYADDHYEAVEQQLLNSVYPTKPKEKTLNNTSALVSTEFTKPWEENKKSSPISHKTNRWSSYLGAIWNNVTRDESKHEMTKLYRRKLPTQVTKMPINIVGDYLLRRKDGSLDNIRDGEWQPIAKKELWGLAANPIAGSHGLVGVKEIVGTGSQLTDTSIKKLNRHFAAAAKSGLAMDRDIQQSLETSRSAIRQKQLSVTPSLKAKVERIQQKDPRSYSQDDYTALQSYFQALSQGVNQQANTLLKPYKKQDDEELTDVITRNVLESVGDLPSALTTLSFIQSILQKEVKNLHSLEFVDPKKNLIPVKSFREIADYMEEQLTSAGIAVVGEEYQGKKCQVEGLANGQMVQFNKQANRYEAVQPETIVRLANVVSAKFKQEIGSNLERIKQGSIDKTHYAFVEKALFSQPKENSKAILSPTFSGEKRWSAPTKIKHERSFFEKIRDSWKHATRPEAIHEAKLLWSRTSYARFSGIPIGTWQHIRRGYLPVDKETGRWKVNPEASIGEIFTNPGKFISRGSLLSGLWGAIAYPIGEFVATIGREMSRYKVTDIIADSSHASDTLSELLHKAPTLSDDWEKEYREVTGKSAALQQAAENDTFKMIPRIAMKPAHLRLEHENLLMQQYMEQAGAVALATASQLTSNAKTTTNQSVKPLENPVTNMAEAHEALAEIKAIMDASRKHLGVLRFVDPNKLVIDGKGLAQLSETIEAQYQAADNAGDLNTEEGFTRLSNVIRDEFLAVVDLAKLQSNMKSQHNTIAR